MNILVTGSNGQLGSEIRMLAPEHPEHSFFFVDKGDANLTTPSDALKYNKEHKIELVINCAAYTAVDRAEEESKACMDLNANFAGTLALAANQVGAWMIHISSDYVFDGKAHLPLSENHNAKPRTTYGKSKLKGEELVTKFCPRHTIIRTSWLYSTFGNNFVRSILKTYKEREQVRVVFDQTGTPTYARDLARVILTIIDKGPQTGIFHYSNEGACSWYDFAMVLLQMLGYDTSKVKPVTTTEYPTIVPRPHYTVLDKTKIKRTYDITIPFWQDSLRECLAIIEQ